jgi:geranylgeranyl diphosphate synthase type I
MDQKLLLVDKNDRFLGYARRSECHVGRGLKHRAFVSLIFNSKNQVLLQKRKHKLFDNVWDLTAISHPLHLKDRDENYQDASDRALKKEMGIGHVEVENIGAFNYFARDGKNCENEYCAVLVGKYDGNHKANSAEVYESKWIGFEDFLNDIKTNPKNYAPWAILASRKLQDFKIKSEFEVMLSEFLKAFEGYSSRYFVRKIKNSSKYPKLITKFYEDLADFTHGGKRMRAFLVYLGYLLGGRGDSTKIFPISLAIEIFHSFLLIHDDIIDKSGTRRGKATIHKRYEKLFGSHYGISQAIVLGDIACFEAMELVNTSEFPAGLKIFCQKKLNETLLETAYGEALDVEYSYVKPNIGDIMNIADLKTARYSFVGPLSLGATLSSCPNGQMRAIREFGLLVGIAFQLQDDYLGIFGDEKILGKSVLSDMREGKNTLLIYKARELATSSDRKVIDSLWGKNVATIGDLVKIKKIIIKSSAGKWFESEMRGLVVDAKKYIKPMTSDLKLQKVIEEMADFIVSRAN